MGDVRRRAYLCARQESNLRKVPANESLQGLRRGVSAAVAGWGWSDAVCVVSCSDETKILALISLPLTNPPRESYANVVLFDDPTGYWGMGDNAFEFTHVEVQDKPPDSVPIPSDSDTGGSGGGGFDDVFGRDLAEALVAHISPGIRETYSGKVGARSRSGRRPAARA